MWLCNQLCNQERRRKEEGSYSWDDDELPSMMSREEMIVASRDGMLAVVLRPTAFFQTSIGWCLESNILMYTSILT